MQKFHAGLALYMKSLFHFRPFTFIYAYRANTHWYLVACSEVCHSSQSEQIYGDILSGFVSSN